MPPAALPYLYCTEQDLQSLLSVDGETGRLDDDASGTVTPAEQGYLTAAINWATARVNFYCASRYATADLSTSWVVNQWAVVLAGYWLSCRRSNPSPGSIKDLYEEVMEDLKQVRSGEAQLPEIGLRTAAWPSWSAVRIDCLASLRKIRVERVQGLSDTTPQAGQYRGSDDIPSMFIPPPF